MTLEDRKWLLTVLESCAWTKSSSSYRASRFVVEFVEPNGSEIDLHLRDAEIYLVSKSGLYVCEVSSRVADRIAALGS
jgi:predicted RNA methylase